MRGFVVRYSTADRDNYFGLRNEDYDDKLYFTSILDGTFTNYNEEITSKENEFDIVFGDFSIAFSLNNSIISLGGLNVKEFFKPSDNTLYKYAVIINLGVKEIGGIMDNEQTTVDKSFLSGRWDITISFFSWEKEFSAFCITPPQLTEGTTIDDFIENYLFRGLDNGTNQGRPRLGYDLNFNWSVRNASDEGFTPVIIWQAYNQMLINGISETGWQLFKELAFGLGFIFKLKTNGLNEFNPHFINVVLWCGWRSEGIHHRDIHLLEPHTETNQISSANYLLLGYRQDIATNNINTAYRFSGIMKNKDNLYIDDGQNVTTIKRDFLTVDAPDFTSRGMTISCKNQVRNLENPVVTFPFDKTTIKSVRQIHRIYYFIDRGGEDSSETNYKYYFVNSYALQDGHYQTSTVAFCRLFVKHYEKRNVPGTIESLHLVEIDDEGWYDQLESKSMIQRTAGREYDFLMAGNKNIINTDIHFDTNTEIEIYDTTTINDKNYWLRRLTNINLSIEEGGQRATTEWVEI